MNSDTKFLKLFFVSLAIIISIAGGTVVLANSGINFGNVGKTVTATVVNAFKLNPENSSLAINAEVPVSNPTPDFTSYDSENSAIALAIDSTSTDEMKSIETVLATPAPVTVKVQPKVVTTPAPAPKKVTEVAPIVETKLAPVLKIEKGEDLQPTLLLSSAKRVPFTVAKFTALNGDVNVKNIVIQRTGLGNDNIFSEIGIEDMGTERHPNSNHQYETREGFTLKEGEEKDIVLYGHVNWDIGALAEYDGQQPTLTLVRVDADAPIQGNLPIVGIANTVNSSITIGSMIMSRSGLDPFTNRTYYINDKNVVFSAVKITASSAEPIKLDSISWYQMGSIGKGDISNLRTVILQGDKEISSVAEADDEGKYYTSNFDGITIQKGDSIDLVLKGDIGTTGANRTVDFDINSSYDIWGHGLTFNSNLYATVGDEYFDPAPEGYFSSLEYPFYNGFAHNISGGAMNTIGK